MMAAYMAVYIIKKDGFPIHIVFLAKNICSYFDNDKSPKYNFRDSSWSVWDSGQSSSYNTEGV